jgi:hypothetical protein
MTGPLARLLVGLPVAVLVATAQLLLGVVRLGLWLLGRVGFRGARLAGLAATLAGVWWAAATIGLGPAGRLALIGWAVWFTRHHRAAIVQHATVRRLATAQQAAMRRLTAALEQYTAALAKTAPARPTPRPAPTVTSAQEPDVLATPPWQATDQASAAQGIAALGRYAAGWVRHHANPAPKEPR